MTTEQLIERLKKVPIWHNVWFGENWEHTYVKLIGDKMVFYPNLEIFPLDSEYFPWNYQYWQKITTAGYKNFEVENV